MWLTLTISKACLAFLTFFQAIGEMCRDLRLVRSGTFSMALYIVSDALGTARFAQTSHGLNHSALLENRDLSDDAGERFKQVLLKKPVKILVCRPRLPV